VLRSQLRLQNAFYPDSPADDTVMVCDGIEPPVKTCRVCGCRGPLVCGKCKQVGYCGQDHQKIDWKVHKQQCGISNQLKAPPSEILFPEFEIVIEQEEKEESSKKESEKEAEKRRLKEYEEMVKSGQAGAMMEMSDADLDDFAESKEDKTFGKFKKAIEDYETQVLRYSRHGSPLWISDHAILNPSLVPNCTICKGRRTFEFQIMPQMLNELKNYELDWGVIAVYTCEKDCDVDGQYVKEFCYKQDIMKSDEDEGEIDIEKLKLNAISNKIVENVQEELIQPQKKVTNKATNDKKKPVAAAKKPEKKAFAENDDDWE
jgi:pre-rRNA-processing protein TSR4